MGPRADRRRADAEGAAETRKSWGEEKGDDLVLRSAEATAAEARLRLGEVPKGARPRHLGEGTRLVRLSRAWCQATRQTAV